MLSVAQILRNVKLLLNYNTRVSRSDASNSQMSKLENINDAKFIENT